jgi:hypothetical protein
VRGSRDGGSDDAAGSRLVLVLALPLLVVFVVGIFDFGGAFNTKQMLSNIAREGARFASSLPTNDLDTLGTPPSVTAIRDLVAAHLQTSRLNDCGLAGQGGVNGPATTWTYTAAGGGCPAPLAPLGRIFLRSSQYVSGCEHARKSQYPYSWHFNKVITLLIPAATIRA